MLTNDLIGLPCSRHDYFPPSSSVSRLVLHLLKDLCMTSSQQACLSNMPLCQYRELLGE